MTDLPGLPAAAAQAWLRAACPDREWAGDWSASVISGGLSNITYRIRWNADRLVLRRPPLGPVLPRAHDMHREYRVLTALGPTTIPVPATVAYCADADVIGAPFYVMTEVDADVVRTAADAARLDEQQRRAVSEELVDVLADLHSVDPAAVGLADFGRVGGYAARQLRTWGQQWERSRTRDLADMDRLLAELTDSLPPVDETTIVHGDYRIDNTMIRWRPRPRVAAVLDWELSTLGDPLADLATTLTYWHDRGDTERAAISVAAGLTTEPGFLTTAQLADRYATRTGRSLGHLDFHLALAAMKLAVILEGVHARHLGGQTVGAGYDQVGPDVPILVARGLRLLRRTR